MLPCWEYASHRQVRYSLECACITLVACTDLCTLPVFPSEPDSYRLLFRAVVTCVVGPSGYAEGQRETWRRRRQLLASPECWDARWCPDWFSGSLPNLYHRLSLTMSEVFIEGIIFWTWYHSKKKKKPSDEHLLPVCSRFDLWTEVIKSTVFDSRSR